MKRWKQNVNRYVVVSLSADGRDGRFHGAYRSGKRAETAAKRVASRSGRLVSIERTRNTL